MTAQYLTIEARHQQGSNFCSSLADFSFSESESVDPNIVLTSSNLSLYCFDDSTQRAIFVELPSNVDLSTAPFVWQTQYEQAQRLVAVSYETFHQLAHTLPEVQNLVLIYSSARSGSTLLSHIFNAVDGVFSLSEPDATTQFVYLRRADGSRDAELRDLLDCTIRMLFKPTPFKSPTTCVVKFRGQATLVMDFFHSTFPNAHNLYSYRDAIAYVTSWYRIFKAGGAPDTQPLADYMTLVEQVMGLDSTHLRAYLDLGTDQVSLPQALALTWIANIEMYLAQVAKGIPALAVRYADLNEKREQVISAMLEYCGLPKERAKDTLGVFERDAQAGTPLARENPSEINKLRLTDAELADVTRILARHPVVKTSDFVVPGTLKV